MEVSIQASHYIFGELTVITLLEWGRVAGSSCAASTALRLRTARFFSDISAEKIGTDPQPDFTCCPLDTDTLVQVWNFCANDATPTCGFVFSVLMTAV